MTITPDDLVRREVFYCVSSLVSTLAGGYGHATRSWDRDFESLTEQASELASPIDDWEEAAIQEGWTRDTRQPDAFLKGDKEVFFGTWQQLCEECDIEPYQRDIFEHWIVSDWLADKLAAKGEKVDKDFAGLTVWGRTTTGQGIASDGLIEEIVREMNQ